MRLKGREYTMGWLFFAILSAVFAALTTILAKIGIEDVNSTLATAIRTVVVLVMAWGMVFVSGTQSGLRMITPRSLVFLILSGLATGASWLCFYRALQIGDTNRVVPIDKSSTVLTMLLALIFLGEGFTPGKGLCMAAIAAGADGLMIEVHNDPPHAKSDGAQSLTPAQFDALMGKVKAASAFFGKAIN